MRTRARQRSGALVERAGELAEIERGLDRVESGEPWSVQLVGKPGIGKTRLLAELCVRAEQPLDGRAAEFERDIPFGVVVDALNDYFGDSIPLCCARSRTMRSPSWRGCLPPYHPAPVSAQAASCPTARRSTIAACSGQSPQRHTG
jgi:predicted ATPase